MSSILLISIDEAKYICDKNQYGEASMVEILKLNIRLLYCKATRAYSKRNDELTKIIKKSNIQTISTIDKNKIKTMLHQELSK